MILCWYPGSCSFCYRSSCSADTLQESKSQVSDSILELAKLSRMCVRVVMIIFKIWGGRNACSVHDALAELFPDMSVQIPGETLRSKVRCVSAVNVDAIFP